MEEEMMLSLLYEVLYMHMCAYIKISGFTKRSFMREQLLDLSEKIICLLYLDA